jgi:hypothetical protein
VLRLLALLVYFILSFPLNFKNLSTQQNWRPFVYAFFGSGGAIVNTRVLSQSKNLLLLSIASVLAIYDLRLDPSAFIFISTTLAGDFFAKKLDTFECRVAGIITLIIVYFYFFISNINILNFIANYGTIWAALFLVQCIAEYGDNHLERLVFFRHRYAFEFGIILILISLNLSYLDAQFIGLDLLSCLFYRISNFLIVVLMQRSKPLMGSFSPFGWSDGH